MENSRIVDIVDDVSGDFALASSGREEELKQLCKSCAVVIRVLFDPFVQHFLEI